MTFFKTTADAKVAIPSLAETVRDFAFEQAEQFIELGQSPREATSIVATILVRIAWEVAGTGVVSEGGEPNPDNFRAVVEDAFNMVTWKKGETP